MKEKKEEGYRVEAERELVRRSFPLFARVMKREGFMTPFHLSYYRVLDAFARGKIRRLIITVPPQHGKSEGATRLLPAYLLGLDPDLKIAVASYSDAFARKFNRSVRRIVSMEKYGRLFPATRLASAPESGMYGCTSSQIEIPGFDGSLKTVGRGGQLTGEPVDVMIMDDLYKNAAEGNSPVVRESVWEWYLSTVRTRLHNDSRELMVFTRWHEDDLIGRVLERERGVVAGSLAESLSAGDGEWVVVNFEALKDSAPTNLDPRRMGEALWPERHSVASLVGKRSLDAPLFECMYQGRPCVREGLLYGDRFETYASLPDDTIRTANYTDTADMGRDKLCSVCYRVGKGGEIYITDVVYTDEPMEVTEDAVARMLVREGVRIARIESNNGGRGFARRVRELAPGVRVSWFHQSANKESRILTNAVAVRGSIRFPVDWRTRWPGFWLDVTTYRRVFAANRHHDAPDVLTGIVEKEFFPRGGKIMARG